MVTLAWTARNKACVAKEEVDKFRVVREAQWLVDTIHHCFYYGLQAPRVKRWVSLNPYGDSSHMLNVDHRKDG